MILSNVRKKNKGIIECDKSTITCDIGTAQYEDGTIKCEKKKKKKKKGTVDTLFCNPHLTSHEG